jgi:predicted phosphoribosyltransferase
LKFKDRVSAGKIIGETLKDTIKKEERKNSVVIGIPRGGVITADIIARKLNCTFGMIIPRKLCAPNNDELAIGAVMGDGTTYINEIIVKELEISPQYINKEKIHQLEEVKRRISLYCSGNRKFIDLNNVNTESKTIILVDDGAATGATIIAAARWIKAKKKLHRFIIAIPIVPKHTLNLMKHEDVDKIEVITSPEINFNSIEQYYKNFIQITDEQVINIIDAYKQIDPLDKHFTNA